MSDDRVSESGSANGDATESPAESTAVSPAESEATPTQSPVVEKSVPRPRSRRTWIWLLLVALIAILIAGPGSVALYIARQHRIEQSQVALGAWWTPVSAQLEKCATTIANIKATIEQGTGTQVAAAGSDLKSCIAAVPTTPAPNDTVQLAFSAAMESLNAVAQQTIRLGGVMGDAVYAAGDPDQFAAYLALQKQFVIAQVTLVSLENVVRQAAGQTTTPLPTGAP